MGRPAGRAYRAAACGLTGRRSIGSIPGWSVPALCFNIFINCLVCVNRKFRAVWARHAPRFSSPAQSSWRQRPQIGPPGMGTWPVGLDGQYHKSAGECSFACRATLCCHAASASSSPLPYSCRCRLASRSDSEPAAAAAGIAPSVPPSLLPLTDAANVASMACGQWKQE